jgi:hypothetical protein
MSFRINKTRITGADKDRMARLKYLHQISKDDITFSEAPVAEQEKRILNYIKLLNNCEGAKSHPGHAIQLPQSFAPNGSSNCMDAL